MTTTRAFKIARSESLIKSVQLDKDPFGYSISCLIPCNVRYPNHITHMVTLKAIMSFHIVLYAFKAYNIYSCDTDK